MGLTLVGGIGKFKIKKLPRKWEKLTMKPSYPYKDSDLEFLGLDRSEY